MMRKIVFGVTAVLAALAIAACGGDDDGDETVAAPESETAQTTESTQATGTGDEVMVELAEENGSGESGTATLTPAGQGTRIVLSLDNPTTDSQPAHIHKGSCGPSLDPEPFIGLPNVIDGESDTVVDAPLSELTGGGLAINVHHSNSALEQFVACGNLPDESGGEATGDDAAASGDDSSGVGLDY